jgi:hypothetical protein
MKRYALWSVVLGLAALALAAGALSPARAAAASDWSMNATIIEACSCPMFCQCYFNTKPAAHGEHGQQTHFCKFNNAYKVNKGHYGSTKLDGAMFWASGDLGGDFTKPSSPWAVLTFDKATTPAQREGIEAIFMKLMPKFDSFQTAEGSMTWTAGKGEAHALLDGGKSAEVKLQSPGGASTAGQPVVITNLKYWGAGSNDGFVLMPNVVQAYRVGDKAYEFKGTNGFMITFEIDSKATAAAGAGGY